MPLRLAGDVLDENIAEGIVVEHWTQILIGHFETKANRAGHLALDPSRVRQHSRLSPKSVQSRGVLFANREKTGIFR